MSLTQIIADVSAKFDYTPDRMATPIDEWRVMSPDARGRLQGDCEDFTLTVLWRLCGGRWWRFALWVDLIPRYQMWYAVTASGEGHYVGRAKGLWFDNWTREALPKAEFLRVTGHRLRWPMWGPMYMLPMVAGWITRRR